MKSIYTLFFTLCLFFKSTAQVTIYDENESSSSSNVPSKKPYSKSRNTSEYFKLKTDLEEALFVGTGSIFVEKNFSDLFGLEVGVGITYLSLVNLLAFSDYDNPGYSKNSMSSIFFGEPVSVNYPNGSVDYIGFPKSNTIKYNPGFAISVFPKIYLEEDPTEGFFLGILAAFKNYNFQTPSFANPNKFISQSINKVNFSFNVGYTYNLSDHFITESFMGVGISFVDDVRNGYYSVSGGGVQDVKVTFSPTRFHYQTGARLSYVF